MIVSEHMGCLTYQANRLRGGAEGPPAGVRVERRVRRMRLFLCRRPADGRHKRVEDRPIFLLRRWGQLLHRSTLVATIERLSETIPSFEGALCVNTFWNCWARRGLIHRPRYWRDMNRRRVNRCSGRRWCNLDGFLRRTELTRRVLISNSSVRAGAFVYRSLGGTHAKHAGNQARQGNNRYVVCLHMFSVRVVAINGIL